MSGVEMWNVFAARAPHVRTNNMKLASTKDGFATPNEQYALTEAGRASVSGASASGSSTVSAGKSVWADSDSESSVLILWYHIFDPPR